MSERASGSLTQRHVRFGWAAVAIFMALGLLLETLHGLKTSWYLEQQYETRRLLFTLAHAHGTLFGVLNILFGLTVGRGLCGRSNEAASRLLLAATILLPAGFFLGGVQLYGGDPGLGVALAPIGAVAALIAAALAAAPDPAEKSADNDPKPRKKGRR